MARGSKSIRRLWRRAKAAWTERRAKTREPAMGDGPYRSGPAPASERRSQRWVYAVVALVLGAPLLLVIFGGRDREPLESARLEDLDPVLVGGVAVFPPVDPELRPATPLEPLLAADGPELLAIRQPSPGATRLDRNGPLHIAFNRPMVEGSRVGELITAPPISLRARDGGTIRGSARWSSRSRLIFHADASAWNGVREATLVVDPELQALDGDRLGEQAERVIVFDGTPHLLASGGQRVAAGSPLPLYFDNPVSPPTIQREMLAYEIGGGARSMGFALRARGWESGRFRLDLIPARALEAGAQIGVAIAPRWTRWAGATPTVARFAVQPRPRIEGVGCGADAARTGQCDHRTVPGRIVDIGPTLRVLSTEPLDPSALTGIRVSPRLPAMTATFASAQKRVVAIEGEWAADQVYEVRLPPMRTASGEPLEAFAPLAVRSRGHTPAVEVPTGWQAFERDDPGVIAIRGIATGKGALLRREVPCCGGETDAMVIAAALDPKAFVEARTEQYLPLARLLPEARPNRWGEGAYAWAKTGGDGPAMAVLGFRPGEVRASSTRALFAQRTNLGTTVRVTREGVLAWVSRLHDATPVRGARVVLADEEGSVLGEARTDTDGGAWIPTSEDRTASRSVLLSAHSGDRSVVVLERGRVVGPEAMAVARATERPTDEPLASVFTDRGAYRPGSRLHVKVAVREPGTRAPIREERLSVRVQAPGAAVPDLEAEVHTSRWGSASASFTLPSSMALGLQEVVLVRPARGDRDGATPADAENETNETNEANEASDYRPEARLASASIRVAEFRDPAFRVDVRTPRRALAGEPLGAAVSARYLFGAPLADAELRHSLVREAAVPHAARWRELTFAPADHYVASGTVSAGTTRLDRTGAASLQLAERMEATVRHRVVLEVEVKDRSGQSTAAHREVLVHPAAFEVGLRQGPTWVTHCDPNDERCEGLRAETLVVDVDDQPVSGREVQVTFSREGWHDWWQWSRGAGRYQARRQHRREEVHRCTLESAGETLARCAHRPVRPGTYLIEAETRDDEGRRALASRRVYVAGPDEAPDRDPPGTRIAVTPKRPRYQVGETAELAIESPWPAAEVLVAVEQDGVLHRSRERIGSGGHVVRVPVTEAMVPNAFVSVALLRPRLGPPGERMDLLGPDLRFGMATLNVRPAESRLEVALDAPATARPGEEVTVRVQTDGPSEVTLWAVDEGILRLTGWQTPKPAEALYTPRGAAFAWEDLRRLLASRVAPPERRAGGDGGEVATRTLRPREPVSIATPLWAPALETGADGRAEARVTLPDRDTEYRIVALAMDEAGASGSATRQLEVKRAVVAREALPRFVTEGDELEASFFVTNTSDEGHTAELRLELGGETVSQRLHLEPGADRRIAARVRAPALSRGDTLPVHLEVRTADGTQRVGRHLPIAPAARWTRRHAFGSISGGERDESVGLRFPEGARGEARIVVASHPFLGARMFGRELAGWGDVEHRAARLIALASQLELQEGVDLALDAELLRARGSRALDALLAHQNAMGGFGRYGANGWSTPVEETLAAHALVVADQAGLPVPANARAKALEHLEDLARRAAFGGALGVEANDVEAYALHVLREGGVDLAEQVGALYLRREALGYAGRAHLALAMEEDDDRRETLVLEAAELAQAEIRDPSLPYAVARPPSRPWETGALVEAASRTRVGHRHASALTSALVGGGMCANGSCEPVTWMTPVDHVASARALVAYASLFRRTNGGVAHPTLDGRPLEPSATATGDEASAPAGLARYDVPVSALAAASQLRFEGGGAGPTFYAIEAEWTTPLGSEERIARGRQVSLHRRLETSDGRTLTSGAEVPLGETVRVRLFVHTEGSSPEQVRLADPLGAGFEAVAGHFATSPDQALRTILGMGPSDEVMDPRGRYAARTAPAISHRTLEPNAAFFYFDGLPMGLQEVTYVIRATTPGHFTLAPAQIESGRDDAFLARSALFELRVVEPAP